jgi:hypothetical protein
MEIHRVRDDGDYENGNCAWATSRGHALDFTLALPIYLTEGSVFGIRTVVRNGSISIFRSSCFGGINF